MHTCTVVVVLWDQVMCSDLLFYYAFLQKICHQIYAVYMYSRFWIIFSSLTMIMSTGSTLDTVIINIHTYRCVALVTTFFVVVCLQCMQKMWACWESCSWLWVVLLCVMSSVRRCSALVEFSLFCKPFRITLLTRYALSYNYFLRVLILTWGGGRFAWKIMLVCIIKLCWWVFVQQVVEINLN